MEVTSDDKHSSLLWYRIEYARDIFNYTGPWHKDKMVEEIIIDNIYVISYISNISYISFNYIIK